LVQIVLPDAGMRISRDRKWMFMSAGAAMLASALTSRALEEGWRATTGRKPPRNPASPHVTWLAAIGWAAALGVATTVAEMLAERGAASVWKRRTGRYPNALLNKRG
jgi:hypothetical protein